MYDARLSNTRCLENARVVIEETGRGAGRQGAAHVARRDAARCRSGRRVREVRGADNKIIQLPAYELREAAEMSNALIALKCDC